MQIAVDCRCAETGREEVWVVEPVKAGQEITISYIRERQTDREGEGEPGKGEGKNSEKRRETERERGGESESQRRKG